jgi:hypothetical protein
VTDLWFLRRMFCTGILQKEIYNKVQVPRDLNTSRELRNTLRQFRFIVLVLEGFKRMLEAIKQKSGQSSFDECDWWLCIGKMA